jgi:hypothetical protein
LLSSFLPVFLRVIVPLRRIRASGLCDRDAAGRVPAAGVQEGRDGRQRMLRRPGAPAYEVIIDELAVRRLAAPPPVVRKQLLHLATAGNGKPAVGLRVLPVEARVGGYAVPRCTFSIYDYPDPGDPVVVAVDTVTSDLILTDPAQTAAYNELYARLAAAALTTAGSLDLLTQAATTLPDQ